jgi:hypothetical protein
MDDPEYDFLATKLHKEPSKHLDITDHMDISYELPKHIDLSTTDLPMRNTESDSTKTLQVEQDGKPAITLTTYKHDPSPQDGSTSLLHLFRPIDINEIKRHATSTLRTTSEQGRESCSLMQLRSQLEEHFEGLKREFEVKRGKSWTPLRPWVKEDWEWESDDDEEGVFNWC